ncbi:9871_t:CDS:2, partial [Dentiscutata heterogama]
MSAIATKIVEKYKLTPNMDISELSQYTFEFLKNLTDDRKRNQAQRPIASPPKDLEEEIVREIAKRILQNRYGFSEDQVNNLFTILKNESRHSVTTSDKN